MKWSKYNSLFKTKKNQCLLYNSVTNNFIELTEEQFNMLNDFIADPEGNKQIVSDELIEAGLIVENDKDSYYPIKLERQLARFDASYLSLTIVPTRACNFNCTYCYEADRPDISMDDTTEDSIIEFIKSYTKIDRLRVTWYGGEPLLAFGRIESLTKKFKELNIDYDAHMITNGYLMDEQVIEKLEALSISGLQITIDGLEETHNSRRPHLQMSDSYSMIMQNIDKLFAKNDKIKIALRVNIDKTNEDEYHVLYNLLTEKFGKDRMNVHPGYVTNIYSSCNSTGCEFDRQKKTEFVLKQYEKHNILSNLYPSISIGGCTARHINSFVVGSQGELYKCWNDIGIKEKEIGSLHSRKNFDTKHLVRYLAAADSMDDKQCQNCFFFPVCSGGCAYSRIANEFEAKKIDCCHIAKNKLHEFLEIHYEDKTRGN